MTAAIWKLASIGVIVAGLIAGCVFYYIISPLKKEVKKKQLEEVVSLLINFVIFIWIGKIVINFPVFVSDPLAILAYPSNSKAFYIAVLFLIVNIFYKIKKKNFNYYQWFVAFVPIFLFSIFIYEFIQGAFLDNNLGFVNLGFYAILLILFIFLHGKHKQETLGLLFMMVWSLGQLLLAFILPFVSLFGYLMAPWFLLLMFLLFLVQFIYYQKRKVS